MSSDISATGAVFPLAGSAMSIPDPARGVTRLAVAGIGSSILIMIGASVVRNSWMIPTLIMPASGPPWDLQSMHVPVGAVAVALWLAAILGTGGVVAGLVGVQRGARPPAWTLLTAGMLTVAVLTVLPPAGSTDALDYASYGRIAVLGHSPYVVPPYYLHLADNTFSRSVPIVWEHSVSVYGPIATVEQFLAAQLGGTSAARIVFWLKLWDAAAFGVVAAVADRLLRSDPARRLRAHLLWTINPLLLWDVIAAGHLDVLAAAAGLLGLLALGEQPRAGRPRLLRVLAAGALVGIAADIKINYVLFGLGLAWALRRSPAALAAAAAGALAVLVPNYAFFGPPAVRSLVRHRNATSADSFYKILLTPHWWPHIAPIATIMVVATAVLLTLCRLPAGAPARPAIRPALTLSVVWLFLWPYQFPWYDVMIYCLLVLYPASRLDWLVLARLMAGTIFTIPGNVFFRPGQLLTHIHYLVVHLIAPVVILAAAICLITLSVSGQWKLRQPSRPPATAAPGTGSPRQ
jgi:hypothetical protein